MPDAPPTPQKSKADIQAPNGVPTTTKKPDRPFDEVLREQAGALAVKLLRHPEVGVKLGIAPSFVTDLTKLSAYVEPKK